MAKTNNAPDRPICVATVFGRDEVEVTRSFLRAYGIITLEGLPDSYRDEQWPRGSGASPIFVPASQAQDAIDLLRSTEDDRVDNHETFNSRPSNQDCETDGRFFLHGGGAS